jgi:hypothetical protein
MDKRSVRQAVRTFCCCMTKNLAHIPSIRSLSRESHDQPIGLAGLLSALPVFHNPQLFPFKSSWRA